MITDFIITVFTYLAESLIYASGESEDSDAWWLPPDWFLGIGEPAGHVFQAADSMSVWFPWTFVVGVLVAVLGSLLAGFGIRLTRMLISQFTGGGGNA